MLAIDWVNNFPSLNYVIRCYLMTMEKNFRLIQGYMPKKIMVKFCNLAKKNQLLFFLKFHNA